MENASLSAFKGIEASPSGHPDHGFLEDIRNHGPESSGLLRPMMTTHDDHVTSEPAGTARIRSDGRHGKRQREESEGAESKRAKMDMSPSHRGIPGAMSTAVVSRGNNFNVDPHASLPSPVHSNPLVMSGLASSTRKEPSHQELPASVWQYIFTFVPPVFLGRLLRVNRAFNRYLTGFLSENELEQNFHGGIQPMHPEAIWKASRRYFCPGVPRPLQGMSELSMWKLLRGSGCQFCSKSELEGPNITDATPLKSDSRPGRVRFFWSFGIRSCVSCMKTNSRAVRSSNTT